MLHPPLYISPWSQHQVQLLVSRPPGARSSFPVFHCTVLSVISTLLYSGSEIPLHVRQRWVKSTQVVYDDHSANRVLLVSDGFEFGGHPLSDRLAGTVRRRALASDSVLM